MLCKHFRIAAAALAAGLAGPGLAATSSPQGGSPASSCLVPAAWATFSGDRPQPSSAPAVLGSMARKDVVLLGEFHDQEDHHHWQLQALAGLLAQRPRLVVGFEMFPRRVQPVLDRWVAGELEVKEFLEQVEWDKVWSGPPDYYLPLFQFVRLNRLPMVALNVDDKLSKAVAAKGWEGVPAADREGVGRPAPPPEEYREMLRVVFSHHAHMKGKGEGLGAAGERAFRNFVESQTTWDRAMAEALARQVGKGTDAPLVVGIMGSGHIRYGHGVPHQLKDLGVRNVGTLLPLAADSDCQDLGAGLADAVFAVPPQAGAQSGPSAKPRLGVSLEQDRDGVRVARVAANSLAEKSGLKAGDQLLEVAGKPARAVQPVSASIRAQPDGSWLPLRVRRGQETLELVVKFPVTP